MLEIKQPNNEEWDSLVENSPQGSLFSTTSWLSLFPSYRILGVYRSGELIGGLVGIVDGNQFLSGNQTPAQFQGVILKDMPDVKYANLISIQGDICNALMDALDYDEVVIANHYNFTDVRPFLWKGWKVGVKYTFVFPNPLVDNLWDGLEKDTRYEIKKALKQELTFGKGGIHSFMSFYKMTFERKGLIPPVQADFLGELADKPFSEISAVWDNLNKYRASALTAKFKNTTYYLFAGSDGTSSGASSLLLYSVMEGSKMMDLVGCNDYPIALFKRGFGGQLRPYYLVSK